MYSNKRQLTRRGFIKTALSFIGAAFLNACGAGRNLVPSMSATKHPIITSSPTHSSEIVSPATSSPSIVPLAIANDIPYPPIELLPASLSIWDMVYELRHDALHPESNPLLFARYPSQPHSLLVARRLHDHWEWRPARLRDFADVLELRIGVLIDPRSGFISQFNSGTATMSWKNTVQRTSAHKFDYSWPDEQVEYAHLFDITEPEDIRLQHFLDPYNVPDWLVQSSLGREDIVNAVRTFIYTTMDHYKGVIGQYTILNEPTHDIGSGGYLYQVLGPEFTTLPFQLAREANPDATLILNETRNHAYAEPNTASTRRIAETLKSQGLVDAVGLQMHLLQCPGQIPPQENDVVDTMRSYALPVYVTELDVNLTAVPIEDQVERYEFQARIYTSVINAVLKSGVCKGISFWGDRDTYSWLEPDPVCGSRRADPVLWDDLYKPKPAYWAVWDALMAGMCRLKPVERFIPTNMTR